MERSDTRTDIVEPVPHPHFEFVEDVAVFFERLGLLRMAGRIIGWLLICDPPEQSSAQLAAALRASKGSISTATRMLVTSGLIDRVARPGERRDYFRIRPDGWSDLMRTNIAAVTSFRRLTEHGLHLLDDAPPARRRRLEAVHDFYAWLEAELPAFFARWNAERRSNER